MVGIKKQCFVITTAIFIGAEMPMYKNMQSQLYYVCNKIYTRDLTVVVVT